MIRWCCVSNSGSQLEDHRPLDLTAIPPSVGSRSDVWVTSPPSIGAGSNTTSM